MGEAVEKKSGTGEHADLIIIYSPIKQKKKKKKGDEINKKKGRNRNPETRQTDDAINTHVIIWASQPLVISFPCITLQMTHPQ